LKFVEDLAPLGRIYISDDLVFVLKNFYFGSLVKVKLDPFDLVYNY